MDGGLDDKAVFFGGATDLAVVDFFGGGFSLGIVVDGVVVFVAELVPGALGTGFVTPAFAGEGVGLFSEGGLFIAEFGLDAFRDGGLIGVGLGIVGAFNLGLVELKAGFPNGLFGAFG